MIKTTRIPKRMPTIVSDSLERMGATIPLHKTLVGDYSWIDDYADGEWRVSRSKRCRLTNDGDAFKFEYEVDNSIKAETP